MVELEGAPMRRHLVGGRELSRRCDPEIVEAGRLGLRSFGGKIAMGTQVAFLVRLFGVVSLWVAAAPSTARGSPVDSWGDPLPPHAAARLGTVRFQHREGITGITFSPDGSRLISSG